MAGIVLILLFAYALSWGFAIIGLSAPNSETAQVMSFPILFPLIFISSAFVPVELDARAGCRASPPTSRFSVDRQRLPRPHGGAGSTGTVGARLLGRPARWPGRSGS